MELLTVALVANHFNVSTTYIYKLIKTRPEMKGMIVKKGKRRTYLKPEVIEFLTECISLKPESEPIETPQPEKETVVSNQDSNVSELIETLKNQLEEKDRLINSLVENQSEDRRRHDTIIMTLTQQVQNQSKQLEDLRNKPEVVRPKVNKVSSIRRKAESVETGGGKVETSHPKENWGLFMQAWVQMFQPWKMRRDYKGKKAA
jgi:myosin heavy subunit